MNVNILLITSCTYSELSLFALAERLPLSCSVYYQGQNVAFIQRTENIYSKGNTVVMIFFLTADCYKVIGQGKVQRSKPTEVIKRPMERQKV